MKRIALAAVLLACATPPFAQYKAPPAAPALPIEAPQQRTNAPGATMASAAPLVDVPKYKCEPKPVFPGGAAMRAVDNKRRQFERDLESYKKCMMAYIEERKAMHEANTTLHKAAIEEYNTTMKEVNAALEAAR